MSSRQHLDRVLNVIPELSPTDDTFGADLIPQAWRLHPVPVRLERRRRHRAFAGLGAVEDSGQPNRPSFPADPRTGAIHHDAEQPSGQGGPAFESADIGEDRQPSVLHHFLGLRLAADDRRCDPGHGRMKAADQRAVCALVPIPQFGQEGRIVEFAQRHAISLITELWPVACNKCNAPESQQSDAITRTARGHHSHLQKHVRAGDGLPGSRIALAHAHQGSGAFAVVSCLPTILRPDAPDGAVTGGRAAPSPSPGGRTAGAGLNRGTCSYAGQGRPFLEATAATFSSICQSSHQMQF